MKKSKKDFLKGSLVKLLHPLVRLLLQYGISHREFSDMAKQVFFEAGRSVLKAQDKKISQSQLAVLTGLHRKDITVFLENPFSHDDSLKENSPLSAVVAEWTTNPLYLDSQKKPIKLPYLADDEHIHSFTRLVESVSKDVRPKAHLDELQRLGLATIDESGHVFLIKEAFLPTEDFTQKLAFFTRHIRDHIAASAANISETCPTFFDRSAFHADLSENAVKELRSIVNTEGMELLKKVYRRAEDLSQQKTPDPKHRITFGIYLYDEKENDEAEK